MEKGASKKSERAENRVSYLTLEEYEIINKDVKLISIKEVDDISKYSFDSKIAEYNSFLDIAKEYDEADISKTFLLIHRKTDELLGYMTLSADSIKLTRDEKEMHNLSEIPYAAVPAVKVGKLAINKTVSEGVKRKGYGSFLLDTARGHAFDMNDMGVACRFLTVDADIEYNLDTPQFYKKNGFVENLSNKSRNPRHTISMRKDILI